MSEQLTPNPGSDEAFDQGCLCARLDNARGKGYMGVEGTFVITGNCPLHGLGSDWGKPIGAFRRSALQGSKE